MDEGSPTGRLRRTEPELQFLRPPLNTYQAMADLIREAQEEVSIMTYGGKLIEEPLPPADYAEVEKWLFAAMTDTPVVVGSDGKIALLRDFYRKG